ncbi:acylneuraminate cytidylyltransferase family protein [Clostridium sp. CTA-5]
MINNKKILAIIPARGGSKGISEKNIKLLNDKPLIAYSIEQCKKSKYIDKVIVSTDSKKIAEISKKYGADIPFIRPSYLAQDTTPGIKPIIHAINWFKDNGDEFEYVICAQCTSPFRKYEQIDEAIERLINEDADSIVSICESEISPYWMKELHQGKIKDFLTGNIFYSRRQDVPKIYSLNGAIYIAKKDILLKNENWYTENTLGYVMDKYSSLDIDDILDFKFAEYLIKENEEC